MAKTGGWRATRTWTRLLAIAFIPVLGLTAFATFESSERWETVRASEAQQAGVQHLAVYTSLVNSLARETYLVTASAYGDRFGVDQAGVSNLLGISLPTQLQNARHLLDQQFDMLSSGDPMAKYRATIHSLRDRIDRRDGSVTDLALDLGNVSAQTVQESDRALTAVIARAFEASGSAGTQQALAVLLATHKASKAVYTQLGQLSGTAFDRSDASMRTMRLATAQLDDARDQLSLLVSGHVREAWRALNADADLQRNEKFFADVSNGDQSSAAKLSVVEAAKVFADGMGRLQGYESLADVAAVASVAQAQDQRHDALRALAESAGIAGFLVLLTIIMTALVARSVARPLTRLRDGARRVSEGDLDGVLTPVGGPYELREVTATFEEVVANLRTVESQVGALANGDLDDPVLDQQLPGRLGASLSETVGRLSQAMSEQEELATRLAYEARHDALTGLPNRAAATEEISRALARGRRAGTPVALLYIDLDGFKHVNDNLGHGAGDILLRGTAERLTGTIRSGDFAARIGGDEFLVVTEQAADAAEVVALGDRIVACLSEPHAIGRGMTRVGASIGIAIARDGETDADRMLRDADLAGYRAKASGRGRVELCDEELRAEVSRQSDIESALRIALDNDELELYFQPVVDPVGRASGAEALLRWHRPGVGIVPPNDFIPIAESSDLIIDVGRWVLHRACRHLQSWTDDASLGDLSVSVNLSGRHLLNLTVVDDVRNALEQRGVDPRRLTIEITETTVLTDVPIVTEHLEALRAMGVRVAIDDFGTGYTSLAHLRALPVDVLKIDRSMIVNAGEAPDAHVLALLVDTAHALGLRLVAEGVETAEQLERVQSLGCQSIQGYLFSRPLPADEFRAYLEAATAAV